MFGGGRISAQHGDVRSLPFKDKQFDFCFSNSVLEHVGTLYDQRLAAAEISRVADGYFIQTPNRLFPIEPHFLVPGWQFLPIWIRALALQNSRIGWMQRQRDPLLARAEVEQVRLISIGELRALFPDGRIWREKVGPLTKSLVAWKEPTTI
jgi:hypothetical protein